MTGEFRIRRYDPHFLLALEYLLPECFPARVELSFIPVRPFLRYMMGCVHCAWAEIHEERLVWSDLLGVCDEANSLIHQVFCQVVALFRSLFSFYRVVVVYQFRIVLVCLAAQKAVESLKSAPQRPAVIGACGRDLVRRCQVPLADGIRIVSMLEKHLREKTIFERDVAVAAGITRRAFGYTRHRVRVMVAPGQDTGARGRAQCGGVHVVVA